jgi:hypothetical protein
MKNKFIKTFAVLTIILLLECCTKSYTPHQAANRGGLKCNKSRLK